MIRADHLTKRYGSNVVLDDVSFEVSDGEALALWGPNGAGKTTIVRCILDMVRYEGSITVSGLDPRERPKAVRSLVGYVAQDLAFYDQLDVAETLVLSAELRGLGADRVDEVVEMVELGHERDKRVAELSGGMRQRLGVAVALLPDPPVLLLDEPTSSLDVTAREKTIALIESLRGPERILVLTSHNLDEVGMLVDRVLALEDGRIIEECPPQELAERLGIHSWLHLVTPEEQTASALDVLMAAGFEARRNSHGLIVGVSAQHKADALEHLHGKGIEILDFEVWR